MGAIAIIAYVLLFVSSMMLYKKISNPIVFHNLIWLVWITVSTTGWLGFYTPGGHIYKMFIIGGAVFNIVGHGIMLLGKLISSKRKSKPQKATLFYEYRKMFFVFIQVVMLVYYVCKAIELIVLIYSGMGYIDVRGLYYSEENFASPLEYRLVMFLFDPMIMVSSIVFAINLFDRQYNKFVSAIMLCNIFLRSIISGGRMIVFELAVLIVLNYIYQYKHYIKFKKGKIKTTLVVGFATLVASLITSGRVEEGDPLGTGALKTLISNFTGPFTFLNNLYGRGEFTSPQFGSVMFAGVTDTFKMVTNGLGLTEYSLLRNEVGLVLADFVYIGAKYFNAMPSMYYFFICDFGKDLYFVGCAILAVITVAVYLYCNRENSYKALGFYLLVMLVIAESSMTFLFFNTSFVIAIIYAAIFLSNEKLPKIKK